MNEPFIAVLAVCGEAAIAYALLSTAVRGSGVRGLRGPLAAACAASVAIGVAIGVAAARRGALIDVTTPLTRVRTGLVVVILASAFVARRIGAPVRPSTMRGVVETAALAIVLAFQLPEGAALAAKLADAAMLRESWTPVVVGGALGALAAAAGGYALSRALQRVGAETAIALGAALALLSAVKLVGVGASAVGLSPLTTALADVAGRAVHDSVHVAFVVLQLPDHPFLRDGVYQLILLALAPRLHAVLAAIAVALPLLAAWRAFTKRPTPAFSGDTRAPARRSAMSAHVRASRMAGAAFAIAVAVGSGVVAAAPVGNDELYDPVPEPAIDDGHGDVVVPLAAGRAADGRMRKYAYATAGKTVVFMTVRRPDGTLGVALDACEVCQPKGYSQLGRDYVYCKHCKTPIPIATVGQAGGCNPVPVRGGRVIAGALHVAVAELLTADRLKARGVR